MSARAPIRWALWAPLIGFALFVALVVAGLMRPADTTVPSRLVGRPLPEFALQPATDLRPGVARADLATGQPRLLNVFASWCIPCIAEARQLEALRSAGAEIDGIAIRDGKEDVTAFLARNGNPYARIGADPVSQVQLALGSSGVPETFVIDGRGVIRYQHIGEIREPDVAMLLGKLKEAAR